MVGVAPARRTSALIVFAELNTPAFTGTSKERGRPLMTCSIVKAFSSTRQLTCCDCKSQQTVQQRWA